MRSSVPSFAAYLVESKFSVSPPTMIAGRDRKKSLLRERRARMPMTPRGILEIQSAIDCYEKKFPRKPSPTPAEALAWKAGKRLHPDKGSWIGIARILSLVLGARTRPG